MSSLAIVETTYGPGDQSFLHDPTRINKRGVTLNLASFVAASDTIGHGCILAGTAVAKITSSGLYAPYNGTVPSAANEVQKVTVATSGNTTVGFQGVTAAATSVAADAGGATTLAGLLAGLPDLSADDFDITVGSGGDAGKLIVTFKGAWANKDVPALTATGTGAGVTTSTAGAAGTATGVEIFRGVLFDDVPIPNGAVTGHLGASVVIGGVIRTDKLPVSSGAGHVDSAAITTYTGLTGLIFTEGA